MCAPAKNSRLKKEKHLLKICSACNWKSYADNQARIEAIHSHYAVTEIKHHFCQNEERAEVNKSFLVFGNLTHPLN